MSLPRWSRDALAAEKTCCDTRVAQAEHIGLRHFHLSHVAFASTRLGFRLRDEPIALEQLLNFFVRLANDDVNDERLSSKVI